MTTGLVSFQHVDEIFEKTARAVFDAIKPRIYLIGAWDDHFENIAKLYQWSEHKPTVPKSLGADVALIVTNSGGSLGRVLARAHPYTAVLAYDEKAVIPLEKRTASELLIVAYLNSVSPSFIRGHVRTLLQLQKHLIAVDHAVPIIITQDGARITIDHLFHALDVNGIADVNCDHMDTFFSCFAAFAELTSYDAPVLVNSPKTFAAQVKRHTKTLVLHCRKKADKKAYQGLKLGKKAVVFVHDYANAENRELNLVGIGHRSADYYLAAYYLSLQKNLIDPLNKTRFIQIGDIDRVIEDHKEPSAFCDQINLLLSENALRFRNIAPKINNVDFAAQPLAVLASRLDKALYAELFSKCDNVLETAQMVSGIAQSTLHAKK